MKRRELKTIWSSNSLVSNSGYGVEMQQLLPRLVKDGWPIAMSAFWGVEGAPVTLKEYPEIRLFPKMAEPYGADALFHHGRTFGAHAYMTFQDLPPMNPQYLQQMKTFIPWTPIDKSPVPPLVLDRLKYAYRIITLSKFGQKELEKKGFASTLILEGTDPAIFKPLDQATMRKELNLPPDAFLFGMIAANKENPPRKGFQEALEAFKLFSDKHPEAHIFFHTQQMAPGNFPIRDFANHLGILAKTWFMPDYQAVLLSDSEVINKEMNAFDALLLPSQTEGFGLTAIEAMSCGKPVIVNDTTSMPEMVVDGVTGGICKAGKGRWTSDNAWVYPADVDSLYEQMEKVYKMVKENPKKTAKDTRMHVISNYHIDTTTKKWIEVLEDLQEELLPLKTVDITPKKV